MKNNIKKAVPNIITISRLISLILGFVFFIKEDYVISIVLYIYGAISDIFDGYFARKFNAYTKFGKYLDATIDKLYILSLLLLSLIYGNYYIIIPTILEIIITITNILSLHKNDFLSFYKCFL